MEIRRDKMITLQLQRLRKPCSEAESLRKIEEDFNAIYVSGKGVKRETAVPIEEFAEI